MKKAIVIVGIFSLLLVFSMNAFAAGANSTNPATFDFNHVWSISPLSTLLGFGTVNYNSKGEVLNTSVSLLGIPILSENFMFLQPLKLDSLNAYWDTVTCFEFVPLELGIGAQEIMSSGFFVGGDLDLSIFSIFLIPLGNIYVGIYY